MARMPKEVTIDVTAIVSRTLLVQTRKRLRRALEGRGDDMTEPTDLPGPFMYRDAVVFTCFCQVAPDLVAIEGGPEVECCHCGRRYRKRIAGSLIEVQRDRGPQVAGPS